MGTRGSSVRPPPHPVVVASRFRDSCALSDILDVSNATFSPYATAKRDVVSREKGHHTMVFGVSYATTPMSRIVATVHFKGFNVNLLFSSTGEPSLSDFSLVY